MGDFLQQYNDLTDQLVSYSNFGFAPNIAGDLTVQERHFQNELDATINRGIRDLEENRPENNSLVNRFLRILHAA